MLSYTPGVVVIPNWRNHGLCTGINKNFLAMNLQISPGPMNTQAMIIDKLRPAVDHVDIGHIRKIMKILIT